MINLIKGATILKEIKNSQLIQQFLNNCHFSDQFSFDITNSVKLMYFAPQSFIVKGSAKPEYLFFLVHGKAKLYDNLSNGKTTLIDFFTPPCFIGEMELIDPSSVPFNMQALTDCYCLALSIVEFQQPLLNDPTFLKKICTYLSRKNVTDIQTAARNQSFTLSQRLAAFILLTEHDGIYDEKHTEASQYLGVSYRHLLYVLAQFVDQKILQKQPHKYRIIDMPALNKLSQEVTNSTNR